MSFLFYFYLFGVFIAMLQDLRRREVDDWLNLFLFFSGSVFLFFNLSNFSIASYGFFVFIMSLISFILYSGRFFAGGDAKLIFSMGPLFYETLFIDSLKNFSLFFIMLLFAGAVYGLAYLIYLSYVNANNFKKEFLFNFKNNLKIRYCFVIIIILVFLSYFENFLLILAGFLLFFILLYLFAKSIEKVSFVVKKNTSQLVEGDWLARDITINGKTIKSKWEGLSKQEIKFIKKHARKVLIKEGIPYVPAFMIAFLLFFFKESLLELLL